MDRRKLLWQLTTVGSLPHTSAGEAWAIILEKVPVVPNWPQLPRRSFLENMYVQFSEKFPGLVLDLENRRIYVDKTRDLEPELEALYIAYLENKLEHGAISPDYAQGLATAHQYLSGHPVVAVKGQVTGPVSWGLSVVDQERRPILYDEVLAEAVAKHLRLKAAWQEKELRKISSSTIIFVDEPYMAAFGSAFVPLSREQVISLVEEVLSGIKGLKGVHCCANTDWSILLETSIDILNFDAYGYAENLALYPEEVKRFLERGGIIAWGIVPAGEEINRETPESLVAKLEQAMSLLIKKGIPQEMLINASMITPSCGTGSLSLETAGKVIGMAAEVARRLQDKYLKEVQK
ncbi:MAG: methionine synthase [Anaerolineae bacterium]|nr:methionine synthase [Anaerolineae bacterium]MDW8101889.1 methionine synthase [Anaerolineae bacterium]